VESDVLADVILLDTIGELPATYSLASIVFVGGSIIDRGGHNVLEPAAAGACIVTGAYTHNFHAIVDLLSTGEAIIQLPPLETRAAADRLREVFGELLKNPERRTLLGDRARQLFADNRGATERTMQVIRPLLSVSTVGNTPADSSPSSNPTS
jgi:3-deoxy-D-manno-octulosonic-acid transferase